MMARALGQALAGLALLIGGAGAASAGSFSVAPVRATLSASQSVGMLTVRNTGTTEAVIQLELLKWSQQDGKDIHEATRDVLATPPIFTVPPNGQQIIRVGLRVAPDASTERSYRLFLNEVPPPPLPGVQGLQIALHVSLPVFISPPVIARPVLQWRALRDAQGQVRLSVTNSGNAHVQITKLRLLQADGSELIDRQLSDYVLPGQARSWLLATSFASGTRLQIRAQSDAGNLQSEVTVD